MDYGKQITMLKKKIANEPNAFWKKALRADLGRLVSAASRADFIVRSQSRQMALLAGNDRAWLEIGN